MPERLLGAHMPTSGGLASAVRAGAAIGCTAIQVFTSSPRMWKSSPPSQEKKRELDLARQETGIATMVSHDTYLVNLCNPDEEIARKSFETLRDELARCAAYGIPFVVSHMGSFGTQDRSVALAKIASVACEILTCTPDSVTLCMETTAGQGASANSKFEELAEILDLAKGHSRLGVCLDTCHVFAAGYDIRTAETYEVTFSEFERLIGLEKLKVIHCNDSKKGLGSRVDRHADIGGGEIGLEAFRCLVNDERFFSTPILIETPEAETAHVRNLATLKSLIQE